MVVQTGYFDHCRGGSIWRCMLNVLETQFDFYYKTNIRCYILIFTKKIDQCYVHYFCYKRDIMHNEGD